MKSLATLAVVLFASTASAQTLSVTDPPSPFPAFSRPVPAVLKLAVAGTTQFNGLALNLPYVGVVNGVNQWRADAGPLTVTITSGASGLQGSFVVDGRIVEVTNPLYVWPIYRATPLLAKGSAENVAVTVSE